MSPASKEHDSKSVDSVSKDGSDKLSKPGIGIGFSLAKFTAGKLKVKESSKQQTKNGSNKQNSLTSLDRMKEKMGEVKNNKVDINESIFLAKLFDYDKNVQTVVIDLISYKRSEYKNFDIMLKCAEYERRAINPFIYLSAKNHDCVTKINEIEDYEAKNLAFLTCASNVLMKLEQII